MTDAALADHRAQLRRITSFPALVGYLREEMGWPVDGDDLEPITFEYTAEELGIEPASAAKILEIKRLRPLAVGQPWGIFFVRFEPKRLPVVALRRILSRVVLKKRASANSAERTAWQAEDLLFVSNFGEGDERQICFAHFTLGVQKKDLPTLKVLGWDNLDTMLHLDDVAEFLTERLAWPDDEKDVEHWRERWRSAFTVRHREVIATSKLLAERLAELARAIRNRINTVLSIETENGPVTKLMEAFREALVHDLDADDFADMYAQTIAYGLLSARIADPEANTADDLAAHMRTSPFLRELMEAFLHAGGRNGKAGGPGIDFDELGVSEVVALLNAPTTNMEAILRDFGDRNPDQDPVIHFYERFLKEYDAEKRMKRGVFYTPRPVVSYIVRSVHELLQTEFGLADGLADTATWGDMTERHPGLTLPESVKPTDRFVTILDPAAGTGTFLVEAIEVIHRTLVEKWKLKNHNGSKILDLWNGYVHTHLLPRLHGYELMMAPYAIAHLKIGLKLHETGYRFGSEERARVYLTNTLEQAHDFSGRFEFVIPALAHEAQAVNAVKRHQRFTIVIGNPPYSGISANMTEHAQRLVDAYKIIDGKALNERKLWLQDDYVKFIRSAQMTLEQSHRGILGYITNHGYLDNPTFRGMRQNLLTTFHRLLVLDLHGNANKKERSPDGSEDNNVFDIRQGVAICLAVCGNSKPTVRRADVWGSRESKYAWLAERSVGNTTFETLSPDSPYYFFDVQNTNYRAEYEEGHKINEAMPVNSAGFITARDHFVVDFDRLALLSRIEDFADPTFSDSEIRERYFAHRGSDRYADGDTRGWRLAEARKRVRADNRWRERAKTCSYRPFDKRLVYWVSWMVDWPRPEVMGHMLAGPNLAFHVCRQSISEAWGHVLVTRDLTDDCYVSNKTRERGYTHPLYVYPLGTELTLSKARKVNYHPAFLRTLCDRLKLDGQGDGLPRGLEPNDIFHYGYAVFHSPGYRNRYAEFLKIDFPRLPLTSNLELFRELVLLGGELVALHLVEAPIQRTVSAYYDKTGPVWRYDVAKGQSLAVALTFSGPEKPVVAKMGWSNDTVWIDAVKPKKSAADAKVTGTVGFRGVPEEVWNFHIGGYQVCEKWLKDRRGRTLTADDITHYHRIVIALHETIRIMREIDEVIDAHGGWPGAFATARPPEAATA